MAEAQYTPRLKADYQNRIRAVMKEKFGYTNEMQIPKLDKIVLNMGIGEAVADSKKAVAAMKDLKEIWEIPYSDKAEPVYKGLVHDWRYKEGIAEKEAFPVRAIAVEDYLDDFFFDRGYDNLVGTSRDGTPLID